MYSPVYAKRTSSPADAGSATCVAEASPFSGPGVNVNNNYAPGE